MIRCAAVVEERHDPPPAAAEASARTTVPRPPARLRRAAPHLAAVLVLLAAALALHAVIWEKGPRRFVPANTVASGGAELKGSWLHTTGSDSIFVAWLVGRNADTLLRRPGQLFDAEHCAPSARSLTLSEPLLTLGALAVPASLLTGDPVLAYNVSLVLLRLVMGLALYSLVVAWTRLPAAGLAAAILYAFHPVWTRDVTHAFLYDTSWTLFALLFAQRLFARGRWHDALGLAACIAFQMGTSLYPMLAACLVALPFGTWLAFHYRLRHVRPAKLLCVAGLVVAAAALVYGPFLEAHAALEAPHRQFQGHTTWGSFLPGGVHFEGWLLLGLAGAGLLLWRPGRAGGLDADPRPAALAAGFLVALAATGPNQPALLPNLYRLLASVLPGLDSVRAPARVAAGVHLVVCLLAGLGAAALLWRLPAGRVRMASSVLLLVAVSVVTLRPSLLGLRPRPAYAAVDARPTDAALAFFRELEESGNSGMLFELPLRRARLVNFREEARRIMASAWHHRRTTACYGSFRPPERERLTELAQRLPEREALRELRDLGFTTLILHGAERASPLREQLDAAARAPNAPLRPLAEAGSLAAWSIEPDGS